MRAAPRLAILASILIAAPASTADPAADTTEIRAARMASNEAIARHDADAAVAMMRDDVRILTSGGSLLRDRAEMRAAFERIFAAPGFIRYERSPRSISIASDRRTAAEEGRWKGIWRNECGDRTVSGRYFARWSSSSSSWSIASETFVPLRERDRCAAGTRKNPN